MIVNSRITDYINSLDRGHGEFCNQIARTAKADRVPVIRKETAAFLSTLVEMNQPGNILEVGTAIGYSSLLMCQVMPEDCRITTIENYEKRISVAKKHFAQAGEEKRITLLEGDAGNILKNLNGSFDFIFMDAAKGQYLNWLPDVIRLLPERGVLVSDNVLQDGDIIESRYGVERRKRTIHSRMREYLYQLKNSQELITSIIPIGDGVALSIKKTRKDSHEKD